ncbi:MATE family efflux transporter [Paenibacillus xerothermodurans]|uniref:Probable multidrug resistance protein NorM n=1 Tax=Paenibacillus xerothermodurans TaxID=1977292 RepID=A0A2W1NCM0_PAEXE|nr:MATE family efflux transporter [Paenibacillus xerothermodurans]PZE22237.1 MATE family efflux transporter [Paenibacillus xerothermodurans]
MCPQSDEEVDERVAKQRSPKRLLDPQQLLRLESGGTNEIRKVIRQLVGPSLVENILLNVLQMIVMIMVGHVGAEAVTAVGLTNQPIFFALAIFMALNIGTTAIIARAMGAGNVEEANLTAQQTFILSMLLSVGVIILSYLYAENIMIFMGATPEVMQEGVGYAQIMFLSLGFTILSMSLSAVLRGAGDTRTPMKINVLSNIIVVVLGYPLIYGIGIIPGLGVAGAAIATALAKAFAAIWVLKVLFGKGSYIKLSWSQVGTFHYPTIRRLVKIGLPSMGEQFAMRLGQLVFTIVVSGLGTAVFAAHTICFNIMGFAFMPGMAFALAASTLVGQGLGAGKPDLAEKFGWETQRFGRIFGGITGVCFIILAPYIMMLYTNDQTVINAGSSALRIIGCIQTFQATQFILAGALRGAGDTKIPLISTFVGVCIFRSLLGLLFVIGFNWGIIGAYLSIAIDQIVRTAIIFYRYKSGRWKTAIV